MATTSNAAFISYRREAGAVPALAMFQALVARDLDVFCDVNSIRAGRFDTVILTQVEVRPYFLLVLTPGTLDRCREVGDWVLREIQHAVDCDRAILPLYSARFDIGDVERFLPPATAIALRRYNFVALPRSWSGSAARQFSAEFLPRRPAAPVDVSREVDIATRQILAETRRMPPVTANAVAAQEKFEEGQALSTAGDDDGALAAYTAAVELRPDLADAYHGRAAMLAARGELDRAVRDFSEAIRLMPALHEAVHGRGCVYLAMGDHRRAIEDFDEAVRLKPDYALAVKNRARAHEGAHDYPAARADFDEALRLDLNADTLLLRALARIRSEDFDGAEDDLTRAIRLDPSSAPAFFWRGTLRSKFGDRDGAAADWLRSRELDPDSPLQMEAYSRRRPGWLARLRDRMT